MLLEYVFVQSAFKKPPLIFGTHGPCSPSALCSTAAAAEMQQQSLSSTPPASLLSPDFLAYILSVISGKPSRLGNSSTQASRGYFKTFSFYLSDRIAFPYEMRIIWKLPHREELWDAGEDPALLSCQILACKKAQKSQYLLW